MSKFSGLLMLDSAVCTKDKQLSFPTKSNFDVILSGYLVHFPRKKSTQAMDQKLEINLAWSNCTGPLVLSLGFPYSNISIMPKIWPKLRQKILLITQIHYKPRPIQFDLKLIKLCQKQF